VNSFSFSFTLVYVQGGHVFKVPFGVAKNSFYPNQNYPSDCHISYHCAHLGQLMTESSVYIYQHIIVVTL